MPKRVLVVDDDPEIRLLIRDILTQDGCRVCLCSSGEQALEVLKCQAFDLILADVKMRQVSGLDLLLSVQSMSLDAEVIIMTAYASLETAVEALRGQALDYIAKPFALQEFRQRIRRAFDAQAKRIRRHNLRYHEDLTVDLGARRVWSGAKEVKLSRREFDVLAYLFRHQGNTVSQQELLQEVWGGAELGEGSLGTVKSCVCRLRKQIGDDARDPRHILNVRGVGYQVPD